MVYSGSLPHTAGKKWNIKNVCTCLDFDKLQWQMYIYWDGKCLPTPTAGKYKWFVLPIRQKFPRYSNSWRATVSFQSSGSISWLTFISTESIQIVQSTYQSCNPNSSVSQSHQNESLYFCMHHLVFHFEAKNLINWLTLFLMRKSFIRHIYSLSCFWGCLHYLDRVTRTKVWICSSFKHLDLLVNILDAA